MSRHCGFAILSVVYATRAFSGLLAILLLGGCADNYSGHFTRLKATDYRDRVIAEWTARGSIVPLARGGYRITAVERFSGPAYPNYTRYPDGWPTTVQGAHIWHWKCPKPEWLAEMEGDPLPKATPSLARKPTP